MLARRRFWLKLDYVYSSSLLMFWLVFCGEIVGSVGSCCSSWVKADVRLK